MEDLPNDTATSTEPAVREPACSAVDSANARLGQLWLDALAAERGAAASTLQTYRDDLACYLGWLSRQDPGIALAAVTRDHICDYLDTDHGYAETTVGRRRSVVH